jgi:hypothetical protein
MEATVSTCCFRTFSLSGGSGWLMAGRVTVFWVGCLGACRIVCGEHSPTICQLSNEGLLMRPRQMLFIYKNDECVTWLCSRISKTSRLVTATHTCYTEALLVRGRVPFGFPFIKPFVIFLQEEESIRILAPLPVLKITCFVMGHFGKVHLRHPSLLL